MNHTHRGSIVAGTALAVMALTFSSIGVVAQDESPAASAAAPAAATGYAELDQAMGADQPMAGSRVTIKTQWVEEGPNFDAALAPFEEATGIDVEQISLPSGEHETALLADIEGGSPPDLAVLAQPSALVDYGNDGHLINVADFMDVAKLTEEHPSTAPLYVGAGGEQWGIPYKVDSKSTVWYPIKAFEAAGYAVPTTWDELIALSDQIVADGGTPWCVGIDANESTGWIATDWIEDILLRTAGLDFYNQWTNHEVPFNSPEVIDAVNRLGSIWFTDGYVAGGPEAILATWQGDAMDPMFGPNLDSLEAPGCWMQKQATWYGPEQFPDQKATGEPSAFIVGEDVGMFYFPPIDPAHGKPALGAGDAVMVFADRPEVRALAQFLSTPEGLRGWIETGSAVSANVTTPPEWYEGAYKNEVGAGIFAEATALGFDASDLMPQSGAAFWAAMVDWVEAGGTNTEEVLQAVEDSDTWPS